MGQVTKTLEIATTEGPEPGNAIVDGTVIWFIPLPSIVVNLDGHEATTDLSGKFQLTVPLGTYTLKIEHLLFDPIEETLDLSEEKTYPIEVPLTLKTWAKIAAVAVPSILIGLSLAARR